MRFGIRAVPWLLAAVGLAVPLLAGGLAGWPYVVLWSILLVVPWIVTRGQPAGVRIASVTVPWHGGTVLAGRSLGEVERQEDNALFLAAAAWLVMLGALAATAVVAAWLWPR